MWKAARRLAADVYSTSMRLPRTETYGLSSQIRRSAVSIASNLAEGAGRATPNEFGRFVRMAAGSAFELETQLIIIQDVGLLPMRDCRRLMDQTTEIKKMLYALETAARNHPVQSREA